MLSSQYLVPQHPQVNVTSDFNLAGTAMDSVSADKSCSISNRTWESRKGTRGESRREQQFYRFAQPALSDNVIRGEARHV
jgi:hypothetical protein